MTVRCRWLVLARFLFVAGLLVPGVGCQPGAGSESASAQEKGEEASKPEEKKEPPTVRVEACAPRRGLVRDSITLSGDLRAQHDVDITSRVEGAVVAVHVTEGDRVDKGDVILELDPTDYDMLVQERKLAHEDAVERAKSAVLQTDESKLALAQARTEYERFQRLMDTQGRKPLSEEEFEAKRFAFETATLASKQAEHNARLTEIARSMAKVAWDRAEQDLRRCQIRSPISGQVSYMDVRPGELVDAKARVASVVNRSELYTEVMIPQRYLPILHEGLRVEIRTEAYPEAVFAAEVEKIHPTIDPAEGTVKLRVAVEDPGGLLRPGIYVTAEVILAVRDQALLIPKRARLFEGDRSVIFVVRDGKAVRLELNVGLQTVEELEVIPDGDAEPRLTDQDRIVIRGQNQLRDGARVEIHDPNTPLLEAPAESEARAEPSSSTKKS